MSGKVIVHARPGKVVSYVSIIDNSGEVIQPIRLIDDIRVPSNEFSLYETDGRQALQDSYKVPELVRRNL
jgi:hypothetical protein